MTEFLADIIELAASGMNEQTLCPRALERLLDHYACADAASVWLYAAETQALTVAAERGYQPNALREIHWLPDSSFGRAFAKGRALRSVSPNQIAALINQMPPLPRALYQTAIGMEYPRGVVIAPLRNDKRKLGVLVLENLRHRENFTADDLTLLQTASNVLTLGLLNVCARRTPEQTRAQVAPPIQTESVSFLAHEMRTPLTAIKGYATALMLEEAHFDSATQREFLEEIDRECDTLIQLIEDLLEASALDAGKLELKLQSVHIPLLVKKVVDEIRQTAPRHRFLVEFSGEFPSLQADPVRLAQVLRNLVENAIKYSPQGGLIVAQGEVAADQILIRIADQGIGIAPEHLNRLFEKFFRVKSNAAQDAIGSGLGLPIARSIMDAHGGKIWAESQLGRGTTFFLALPLTKSRAASQSKIK